MLYQSKKLKQIYTMNITYLIGNGFDLNLGLKTRYRDFYDYYVKQPSNDDLIKKFKNDLEKTSRIGLI